MNRKALITGITGQDGSYLAEHLLELGYEVHGTVRRVALEDKQVHFSRIQHLMDRIELHPISLESYPSIHHVLLKKKFDECYHLAAQSYVAESFSDSFTTLNINSTGTHFILEALRILLPECKFYFAGSSEMFGKARETPQNEETPFHPRSPYGISKVTGFQLTRNYRESYDMFCCSGMLFNHESPRRGMEFVTRKITSTAAQIKLGQTDRLYLGNLNAKRDWGYAKEYVRAMHLMLQQNEPRDYVIATGETHSVKDFCEAAFSELDLNYNDYVEVSPEFDRPADIEQLVGDPSKAAAELGWQAETHFPDLVRMMIKADLERLAKQS